MSKCIEALNRFLAAVKSTPPGHAGIHAVIGNEAADLDSMASAIMYGFLACRTLERRNQPHVPVINIPRRDFVLRTEAVYLFDRLGLDVTALQFIDEINLGALHRDGQLSLTLVDHNVLSQDQAPYHDAVEAIIDHHDDSGLYPRAALRRIEPVGSAATLVAEMILRDNPELLDEGTATLLLGTLLLDTVNLSPGAGRVTPKDTDVANQLRGIAGAESQTLFDALQSAKFDVSALGTGDLLRKDYKEWDGERLRYGISSVLTPLANWIAKDPDLIAGLREYLQSRNLHCLIAMMAYSGADGAFHRELAVLTPDQALRTRLLSYLNTDVSGLNPIHPPNLQDADRVDFFTLDDVSLSRKKLQPILHRFFSGMKPAGPSPDTT